MPPRNSEPGSHTPKRLRHQAGAGHATRSRVTPPQATPPYSVVSLFTGAGGLDLGMEAAGFETKVAVEMDPDAVLTLKRNRKTWEVIDQDVHSDAASSSELMRRSGLRSGDATLLIGGPPCQPFSKSGYWATGDAKRLADPRAGTLAAYLRVLRDLQPRAFLLENVPGLAFSEKDEGLVFLHRSIDRMNRELGTTYSFRPALLRAVKYGVPQDRHRVFVVGSRDGIDFEFPGASHAAPPSSRADMDEEVSTGLLQHAAEAALEPFHSSWDAIGDLEDDDDPALSVTGKWAELLPTIPEGRNYLYHTTRGKGRPIFGWRRRYWSFLLKLSKRLPSATIAAQPGPAIGPFHWKSRRLSIKEMMRLQTFPEAYEITGNVRAAQRQLGNAVPSALAEKLGLEIRRQLLGERDLDTSHVSLLPPRRTPVPAPEPVKPVPEKYLAYVGDHEAHPGTGRGYGALRRAAAAAAAIPQEMEARNGGGGNG